MPSEGNSYQVGHIGQGATVLQGEYLTNVTVQVQNIDDARAILALLNKQLGKRSYHGPLLRRLDPIVLANRASDLGLIRQFFEESDASVLFVVGLAGIGKSTLVRGALEYRGSNTPVVWITCESLDVERLFTDMDAGLALGMQATLRDSHLDATQKAAVLLAAVPTPAILVLDNFEDVLNEDDKYKNAAIAAFIEALTSYEHRVKTVVTSRRLPSGVGAGSAGVDILRLGGLSDMRAVELFQVRTSLSASEIGALLTPQVIAKLEGHPKLIELLASAVGELPVQEAIKGLLTATDIGDYIVNQVLDQLSETEMDVLCAASVFRDAFSFEALTSIYRSLCKDDRSIAPPVRSLVRRAVLEMNPEPQVAYYLHALVRDTVPCDAYHRASAHAAAAQWFGQQEFIAEDLTTWDDTLYHLRRAAEIGRQPEFLEPYKEFVFDRNKDLEYAGWGRRNVSELQVLDALTSELDSDNQFLVRWMMGIELWLLGDYEQALDLFSELSETLTEYLETLPAEEKPGIAELLLLVNAKLGETLVELREYDEACKYADRMKTVAEASTSIQHKLRYTELRFSIARKTDEPPETLLHWAEKSFELAQQWIEEDDTSQTRDALAEAHFNLAIAHLQLANWDETTQHFLQQLRLKIEIGKLSGVGAGLLNLGTVFSSTDPMAAAAMLLTSEQIRYEIGEVEKEWIAQDYGQLYDSFLSDPANFAPGCNLMLTISDKLLPYYSRMLERRTGAPVQLSPG